MSLPPPPPQQNAENKNVTYEQEGNLLCPQTSCIIITKQPSNTAYPPVSTDAIVNLNANSVTNPILNVNPNVYDNKNRLSKISMEPNSPDSFIGNSDVLKWGKSREILLTGSFTRGLRQSSSRQGSRLEIEDDDPFQFLEGATHLFLRKCKKFPPELITFNPNNKRGLWNSSGRVVYYTGTRKIYFCKFGLYSGFVHEVVDYLGQFVIKVEGRQLIFGLNSRVEIFLENGRLLGSMHQSLLDSTYKIKDPSGRLIYIIQAPCYAPCAPFVFWCCNEHFEICKDDGVSEIGRITKCWGNSISIQEFQSCLGIWLDKVDEVRTKGLLVGCFFLIEFQYFRKGGNGYIYFILMILTLVTILLVSKCMGQCPDWLQLLQRFFYNKFN